MACVCHLQLTIRRASGICGWYLSFTSVKHICHLFLSLVSATWICHLNLWFASATCNWQSQLRKASVMYICHSYTLFWLCHAAFTTCNWHLPFSFEARICHSHRLLISAACNCQLQLTIFSVSDICHVYMSFVRVIHNMSFSICRWYLSIICVIHFCHSCLSFVPVPRICRS